MNPRAVRRLFKGRPEQLEGIPTYGEVPGEGVYLLTRKRGAADPAAADAAKPRQLDRLDLAAGRYLAEQAEAGGAFDPPRDRRPTGCSSSTAASSASAPATRGAARRASRSATSSPASDIVARVTVLAEGTAGHLTGAALDHFGLHGRDPQIWALGVKEVWRVPRPLTKIIHTMGWPLRKPAKYGEFGGSFIYPMGEDMVSLGFVVGLDYRDVELSAHDLLQEFKTHPLHPQDPRRRRAHRVGREDDHRGRAGTRCRAARTRPGWCSRARAPGSSTCRG